VNIIQEERKNVLTLPAAAVRKGGDKNFVLVPGKDKKPERRAVSAGLSDGENVEIISGLSEGDRALVLKQNYSLQKKGEETSSPFMPQRPGARTNRAR
ncbi:MAG TPA: hypothetical protein P5511_00890, partial [Candidatus Goldiibacteriota bacterium]|nr:hypothetical protein [Candidatus Goldiibacteriota bacterium]